MCSSPLTTLAAWLLDVFHCVSDFLVLGNSKRMQCSLQPHKHWNRRRDGFLWPFSWSLMEPVVWLTIFTAGTALTHVQCAHQGRRDLAMLAPIPYCCMGVFLLRWNTLRLPLFSLGRFLSACAEPVVVLILSDTDHLLSLSFPFTLQSVVASLLLVHYRYDQYSLP